MGDVDLLEDERLADLLLLTGARIERRALLADKLVLIGPANELGVFLRVLQGALAGNRQRFVVLFKELDLFELCIKMDDFLHAGGVRERWATGTALGGVSRRAVRGFEGALYRGTILAVDGGCGGREGTEAGRGGTGTADPQLGKGTSRDGGEIELENRSGPDDGTWWWGGSEWEGREESGGRSRARTLRRIVFRV